MSGEDDTERAVLDPSAPQLPRISASGGVVHQHTTYNQREVKEEKTATGNGGDQPAMLVLMQQQMQSMQRQIAAMQQAAAAAEQHRGEREPRRAASSAADTLPTPVSTFRHPAAMRAANPRRLTFGNALSYPPDSPASPVSAQHAAATAAAPAAAAAAADAEAMSDKDLRRLRDALAMSKGHVEPFYADTTKDKNANVLDFVEKIESAMGDCGLPHHLRITMVRWYLRDAPLRWLNSRLQEMEKQAVSSGRDVQQQPIDWDADVRRQFIRKYVGPESTELRLGELSALSVGKDGGGRGKFTAHSPSELEGQFDKIARHIDARTAADDDRNDLLLVLKYKEIIHRSQPLMYERIVLNCRHDELMSLREWKAEFAHVWARFEELNAAKSAAAATTDSGYYGHYNGRGRGAVRGRGGWTSGSQPAARASVSAMSEGGPNVDGEDYTTEGEPDTQLSAASSSGQRGGRGGSRGGSRGGGRGGDGGRGRGMVLTDEQQKLYDEGLCFTCKRPGHQARFCTSSATQQATNQSNAQAGQ
jgi:hypothetical protein